jgi:hypothetical protein
MSTNTGTFWGGATRYYGNGGGYGKQPGDLEAFASGNYAGYAKSLVDHVTNQVKSMNGGSWPRGLEEWVALAKQIFTGGLYNMIGSLINGNLGKMGFTQPANALLNDEPTGYWHVTIGNPLNPIAMMGNMICTDWEMTMGEGLGYDDFPVNVAFSCKVSHCKPRDASGIEVMFNAGRGRYMHTPFLAEVDQLPDDMKRSILQLNGQMKKTDSNTVDPTRQKFSQSAIAGSESGTVKRTNANKLSAPTTEFQENLYRQIDNVVQMLR